MSMPWLSVFPMNLLVMLLCFVSGACIAAWCANYYYRRRFAIVTEQKQQLREELAGCKGQLIQLQENFSEKDVLLKETRAQLGHEFENLANRIFEVKQTQFDRQNTKTLAHNLEPLKIQINEFKQQVANAYEKENTERNKLVGKIGELQLQTQKIGKDAVTLAQALKNDNKMQGHWGEIILERLLEESGLQKGREYDTQVSLKDDEGNRRNPDVVIYLPEEKQLIIDAKVSLIHYESYLNAVDEKQQTEALQLHVNSVRQHIKRLGSKCYESLKDIQAPDFIFIFMPIEPAFILALQHDPALLREAHHQKIALVSPTTLMATLQTVSNLWRHQKQYKNAELIATQAGGLYDQFVLVMDSLNELGNQLEKVQNSYQQTRNRLVEGRGNMVKRVEKLRHLGAKTKKKLPADLLASGGDES